MRRRLVLLSLTAVGCLVAAARAEDSGVPPGVDPAVYRAALDRLNHKAGAARDAEVARLREELARLHAQGQRLNAELAAARAELAAARADLAREGERLARMTALLDRLGGVPATEVAAAIRAGRVIKGMTADELASMLGRPATRTDRPDGAVAVYKVRDGDALVRVVTATFVRGLVVDYEDEQR
ncbi:MAG TPA: hypothetical protein VEA69_06540 [Tepidisphaeraceae bacterium]|nr:hypothetical protein [Tepidisphaeraceae bacterium]